VIIFRRLVPIRKNPVASKNKAVSSWAFPVFAKLFTTVVAAATTACAGLDDPPPDEVFELEPPDGVEVGVGDGVVLGLFTSGGQS
jgi:hypothetical protein